MIKENINKLNAISEKFYLHQDSCAMLKDGFSGILILRSIVQAVINLPLLPSISTIAFVRVMMG